MQEIILKNRQKNDSIVSVSLTFSKSISNRLVIIGHLAHSPDRIRNISDSDDTRILLSAVKTLNNCSSATFHVHNAGTSARFLIALLSITKGRWIVEADERMQERPVSELLNILTQLGAKITQFSSDRIFPLTIEGKELECRGLITLKENLTSQIASALLLIAPYIKNGIKLSLPSAQCSLSYIEMTLRLMQANGAEVKIKDNIIRVYQGKYQSIENTVETDWSSASFFYSVCAIGKEHKILLRGLNPSTLQADCRMMEYYSLFGVKSENTKDGILIIYVPEGNTVKEPISIDIKDNPDLFPSLAVTAFCSGKETVFHNVASLRVKESDRLENICEELNQISKRCYIRDDKFLISKGENRFAKEYSFHSYNDHRLAMAFAPLTLKASQITIDDKDCVSKSFPYFWQEAEKFFFLEEK